jgi:hypothetical protein
VTGSLAQRLDEVCCGMSDRVALVVSALLATSGGSQGAVAVNATWDDNGCVARLIC